MKTLLLVLFINFLLLIQNANAQLLKLTTQKIKQLHHVSFTEIVKFKFSFQDKRSIDTVNSKMSFNPNERQIGGYYKIQGNKDVYLFDGNKAVWLNLRDTTYKITKDAITNQFTRSLLYWGKKLELYLTSPSKIKHLKDTTINKSVYSHFLIKLQDTIQKHERLYDLVNILVNKKTHLPFSIKSDFKGFADDGTYMGAIEEHIFKSYKDNENNFPELSNITIPEGFKLPIKKLILPPLTTGISAPQISLHDVTGKSFDVTKLRDKIILMSFTVLGCPHCINSAQMLSRLKQKYDKNSFEIISVYQSINDNDTAISKFDKRFNIKYPSYLTEDAVENTYHFNGYPYFFLIDKQGKISQCYEGFYIGLEEDVMNKIKSIN